MPKWASEKPCRQQHALLASNIFAITCNIFFCLNNGLVRLQDMGKENIDVSLSRIARLEEQNKSLRQEKKDLESEMWNTKKSLRDEICRLEDEIRATNKKMRDAETKYVNLAATPPKVQVRTVQVVSEEMKRELEEAVSQNREFETLLKKAKVEHSSKVGIHIALTYI